MVKEKRYCRKIVYTLFLILSLNLFSPALFTGKDIPAKPAKKLIVIDAGHGGKDTGSRGASGLTEKEITLKLALILKDILIKKPNLNVLLTRSDNNIDISPEKRVSFTNSKVADVFLSIHVNASFDGNQKGIEIYYYSEDMIELTRSPSAEEVSNIRTQSVETNPSIFSWNKAQNSFISKSLEFAKILENHLHQSQNLDIRGIRSAPLFVLTGTTMPSLVIEVGFITNPVEESALSKEEYLKAVASKLAEGISEYVGE